MIIREDEDLPRDKEPLRRDRGFGVLLLLAGKDWGTREWRERSMRLIRSEVRQVWPILIPTERLHEQNWFSKNQSKFHADKPDKTAGEIQTG